MNHRRVAESGVTIVELMIAGLTSSLVVGAIFATVTTSSSMFASQASVAETQQAGRFGLDMIAGDLGRAGHGATANCLRDPSIVDPVSSCQPWDVVPGMKAIHFHDAVGNPLGSAAAFNPSFQPDEIWIMTNPYPGHVLDVAAQSAGSLTIVQPTTSDAMMQRVLNSHLLLIDQRGTRSFRGGPPLDGILTPGGGIGSEWTLRVNPPPTADALGGETRGYGGSDARISAVAWLRYYLRPVSALAAKVDLVRETWATPRGPVLATDVIADDVVDLQVTFCVDRNFDPLKPPLPPAIQCGIEDEAEVNGFPERLRGATITLRTRSKGEDPNAVFDPAFPLRSYDLDGNTTTGVARVRTMVRTASLMGIGL
ncbi:MAG: hypothetical protein HY698_02610 [Deltaproteobacteria bacterium]|nr:hypothetical protein [Deltaproteobacteria bacterium]